MFNLVPATWSHPMTKRGALPLSPALNKRESGNILCRTFETIFRKKKKSYNLLAFNHTSKRISDLRIRE